MESEYTSIPTLYAGALFRSRLEARWAAFFDLLGWKWNYEPNELRRHIPDFQLVFPHQTVMVSVKPYSRKADLIDFASREFPATAWDGEWLMLGNSAPLWLDGDTPACGILSQKFLSGNSGAPNISNPGLTLAPAAIGTLYARDGNGEGCTGAPHVTLQHSEQNFYCYVCGKHPGGFVDSLPEGVLFHLWNLSGNAVQWKSPLGETRNPFRYRLPGPTWSLKREIIWGAF